ncbi:hypothetical protein [Mycolicibacterium cosmeticum]|uniref:hypothetical protein n=1 Tax=Mycolicibacterium cosmeticum TaxID=258533 RepID=UPI0032047ABB
MRGQDVAEDRRRVAASSGERRAINRKVLMDQLLFRMPEHHIATVDSFTVS